MTTYVEIGNNRYEASISGKMQDSTWNNRPTKSITLGLSYEEVKELFVNNVEWNIICEDIRQVDHEEDGTINTINELVTDTYDNSEYSIVGDITVHSNGTTTVKMGKPTAEEKLALLENTTTEVDEIKQQILELDDAYMEGVNSV